MTRGTFCRCQTGLGSALECPLDWRSGGLIRIETTAPGFGLSGHDGTQSVQGCVDIGFGWVVRPLGNCPDRHRIPGRDTTWQRPLKGREGGIALSLLPIVSQRRVQDQCSCQADRIDGARGDGRLGILSNLNPPVAMKDS